MNERLGIAKRKISVVNVLIAVVRIARLDAKRRQGRIESLCKRDDNFNDSGRNLIKPSAHAPMEILLLLSFFVSVPVR